MTQQDHVPADEAATSIAGKDKAGKLTLVSGYYRMALQPVARSYLSVGMVMATAMGTHLAQLSALPSTVAMMLVAAASARISGWRTIAVIVVLVWIYAIWLMAFSSISNEQCFIIGIGTSLSAIMARLSFSAKSGPRGLYPETMDTLFNTLLENVPLILISTKGSIRRASPAAARLFETTPSNMETLSITDLAPNFDIHAHAGKDSTDGPVLTSEPFWTATSPNGTAIPVELHLYRTPNGPLIRFSDLRASQAADEQARQLHSQLNKVWRLNSLGEMAATLAHELNQPLGAAASYLHAAQEDMKQAGPMGQSALRTSELAKAQMLRAGQIIRRMRELLSLEMRNLSHEKVRRVVEDVLPILNLSGQGRNIQISVDIDSPDSVRMDRIQFQQALVNLVRNAVEASPDESRVLITGRIISEKIYEIAVEDSGPGIAPDQIDSVFQPMTSTKKGGMGLGLSVTRTIVESHGSSLRVGKSRWDGARFSFNLVTSTLESNP